MPSAGASLASLAPARKTRRRKIASRVSFNCPARPMPSSGASLASLAPRRRKHPGRRRRPGSATRARDAGEQRLRGRRGPQRTRRAVRARPGNPAPGNRGAGNPAPGAPAPPRLGPMGLVETAHSPSAVIGWRNEPQPLSRAWLPQHRPRRGTGRPRHPVPQPLGCFAWRSQRALHCVLVLLALVLSHC